MSDKDEDYAAEAREMFRNPRLARAFTRGQLLGLMGEAFAVYWRVAYATMADGAPLPPINCRKVLAWQLQQSTAAPGTKTIITMDKTMGRASMAMVALPHWLQSRQLEPRDIHLVARTTGLASEFRRRTRMLDRFPHRGWMQDNLCPDFTEEARDEQRRSLVPGKITWGTPTQPSPSRFLDDIIVCDPLMPENSDPETIQHLARWLEAMQTSCRRPDILPTLTVLADRAAGGELAGFLASRGWVHIDIPAVAPPDFAMPIAPMSELTWQEGSPVVLQPYTPYQLVELRRLLKPAAFEVSYS